MRPTERTKSSILMCNLMVINFHYFASFSPSDPELGNHYLRKLFVVSLQILVELETLFHLIDLLNY